MTVTPAHDSRPNALVVYESEFGATRLIAEAITVGLRTGFASQCVSVADQFRDALEAAALIVLGAPTHVHGLTTVTSRGEAWTMAQTRQDDLAFEGDEARGMREWLETVTLPSTAVYATFGTRAHGPALLTGSAAAGIARRLRRRGLQLITEPMAFTVDEHHHLESGQQKKAEAWGAELVSRISPAPPLSRDEVGRSTAIVTTERER
ncbi:flavodoxin [Humibacter sp. BT305]|nr:flavodoxin [Humibacter sp. BT305]